MTAVVTGVAELRRLEISSIREICQVPEPLTVTEWADKYRVLPETSTAPGPFRSEVIPYARRWMNLLADPTVSCVALCWATQTCKSTVIENGLGYRIHRMPSPIVVLRPKIDDAEGWAKERLVPMIMATPVLRARVRLGRSTDSTLRFKRFPGGFVFVASAESATECASRSAPAVFCDEVDRMHPIPGEGNPVSIVSMRQGAAEIGLLVVTSTPRDAETTLIWPFLEGGTDERYHVPCPHCGHYQELLFGGPEKPYGLKWPRGKPSAAIYLCASCAAAIEHREKRMMLNEGDWIATRPENSYPSSHLSGLYSPFAKSAWSAIATEWEAAQGKPADLQVVVNTRLAELWNEPSQQLDADVLTERLDHSMQEGIVPNGAAILTTGLDTQDNRVEAYTWAWGPGLESWLIASEVFPGDPDADPKRLDSVWRKVLEWLGKPLHHVSGRPVAIRAALIDSGGHKTGSVYGFTQHLKGLAIFACKGVGGPDVPLLGKPSLQGQARVVLYPVGVDTAKKEFLRSQLLEEKVGPGFVHLPGWLTQDQCRQLVSEKRVRRIVKGRVEWAWVEAKKGEPTEGLDCRNYARAALELLGPRAIAGMPKLAEDLAAPYQGASAPAPVPVGRRVRSRGIDP